MANFAVANSTTTGGSSQFATSANYNALVWLAASTGNIATTHSNPQALKRSRLYDILVGTNGTPADNAMEFDVCRVTISTTAVLLGTVSSISSGYMLDPADAGFGSLAAMNSTVTSSNLTGYVNFNQAWYVGVNQRASYRWVAAPGSEIVLAANTSATGNNGLMLRTRSPTGYTGTATGAVMVSEL